MQLHDYVPSENFSGRLIITDCYEAEHDLNYLFESGSTKDLVDLIQQSHHFPINLEQCIMLAQLLYTYMYVYICLHHDTFGDSANGKSFM